MSKEYNDVKSFLGDGTEFNGVLSFEGTVRVDGKFEGEVISKDTLVVGDQAKLSADISVGTIIIMGKVEGNITAIQKVEITKGGEVFGNIKSPSLLIEYGAIFEGHCEMVKKDKKISVIPKAKGENNITAA